jgi:hypothetical protein
VTGSGDAVAGIPGDQAEHRVAGDHPRVHVQLGEALPRLDDVGTSLVAASRAGQRLTDARHRHRDRHRVAGNPGVGERLPIRRLGLVEVTSHQLAVAERAVHERQLGRHAEFAVQLGRLVEHLARRVELPDVDHLVAQVVERGGEPRRLAEPAPDRHLFDGDVDGLLGLSVAAQHARVAVEHAGADRVGQGGVVVEERPAPVAPLPVQAGGVPQVAEPGDDAPGELVTVGVGGEAQGAAELGFVGVEPAQRFGELAGALHGLEGLGVTGDVLGVTLAEHLGLAGGVEPARSELADALEQGVAGGGVGALSGGDHRLVDEGGEQVEHVELVEVVAGADAFGGFEREAAGEHAEAPEEGAFGVVEEVVAPLDRAEQRLLSRDPRAVGAGEQLEALAEPPHDLVGRHRPDAGGGELDGERDAVEVTTDRHDVGDVGVGHLEGVVGETGAVDEEPDRVVGHGGTGFDVGLGQRQRRDPVDELAGDAEALAAGREHVEVGTPGEQVAAESGDGVDDLFAVVEHDQHLLGADRLGERAQERLAADRGDPEPLGDLLDEHVGVADGAELGHAEPVGEVGHHLFGDADGEPGLAGAAGPRQRDHPVLAHEVADVGDLAAAADEAGELDRERVVGAFDGPQARVLGRQLGVADLVEVGGLGEAAQAVDAEVEQLDGVGEGRSEPVDGRLRHDDLVGVRAGGDPGGTVDGAAEVVAVAQRRRAGVHPDPHREVEPVDRVAHGEPISIAAVTAAGPTRRRRRSCRRRW